MKAPTEKAEAVNIGKTIERLVGGTGFHSIDFGKIDDGYFIAMEYLFGKDLKTVLSTAEARNISLSLENALHIASRISSGLDYAHNMKDLQGNLLNIIHRDVSPQNIFITYDGQVKIIDFGIAKAASRITSTRSGDM